MYIILGFGWKEGKVCCGGRVNKHSREEKKMCKEAPLGFGTLIRMFDQRIKHVLIYEHDASEERAYYERTATMVSKQADATPGTSKRQRKLIMFDV